MYSAIVSLYLFIYFVFIRDCKVEFRINMHSPIKLFVQYLYENAQNKSDLIILQTSDCLTDRLTDSAIV